MLVTPTAANTGEAALNMVIVADPVNWRQIIKEQLSRDDVSYASFAASLQKRFEGLMLLPSDSYIQRVRADYLTELKTLCESVWKEL